MLNCKFKYSQHDLPCTSIKQLNFENIIVTILCQEYAASTYKISLTIWAHNRQYTNEGDYLSVLDYIEADPLGQTFSKV
jgi:hypothetical protein